MLSSDLVNRAQAFATDQRLPTLEGCGFRLRLIRVLQEQGQQLAKVSAVLCFTVPCCTVLRAAVLCS